MLLRKARAFQIGLSELNGGRNPAQKIITKDIKPSKTDAVEKISEEVRKYLGISFDDQFTWKNPDSAFKAWRTAFYDAGIYVFKDAFGKENNEYSGFSLHDSEFPIIYVNNSNARTRQIFTLFHELGHLLFHTGGVDRRSDEFIENLEYDSRRIEVVCNRMAANTLVPDEFFDEVYEEFFGAQQIANSPRTLAEELANHFSVSREMIYRKFLDRNLIGRYEYERAANDWAEQLKSGGNGGNKYYTWLAYLGREYISLAFQHYYQRRISFDELGEYLDIKPRNLDKLEGYLVRE